MINKRATLFIFYQWKFEEGPKIIFICKIYEKARIMKIRGINNDLTKSTKFWEK